MSDEVFPILAGEDVIVQMRSEWKSREHNSESGRTFVQEVFTYPWRFFTMRYNFARQGYGYDEANDLIGFFDRHRGRGETFLFRPYNYAAAVDQAMGQYQAGRNRYALTHNSFGNLEPIGHVDGSLVLKGDDVVISTGFTVDSNRVIQFTTPPADGTVLTWTGDWYLRCRFTDDDINYDKFADGFFSARGIEIRTDKL